ncbi:MAG: CHASE2 domain-containing protein [Myxococcaceae bacterium]|nr:CHASE2 domain-containing protein [Myxococcaceae bacterium]
MAFAWAIAIGGGLALLGSAPVQRDAGSSPRWHELPRLWLQDLEQLTVDWRLQELGATRSRRDEVVVIAVDDETLASAREAANPLLAMQPWPRELLGGIAGEVIAEGAAQVWLDVPLDAVSPRTCVSPKGERQRSDDDALGASLDALGGQVVVPFAWSSRVPRVPDRELKPFVLKVSDGGELPKALPLVRGILARREQPVLVRAPGKWELWVAVGSEARAKDLAAALELKPPLTVRPRTPADGEAEVDARWLLVELSRVDVPGLDPDALPLARSLSVPVGALLSAQPAFGVDALVADDDGLVRKAQLLVAVEHDGAKVIVPSAALAVARRILGGGALHFKDGKLQVGRLELPLDEHGALLVTFDGAESKGLKGTLKRSLPAWRVWLNLDDQQNARAVRHHDNELEGRIAILTERTGEVRTAVGAMSAAAFWGQAVTQVLHGEAPPATDRGFDLWLTIAFAFAGAFLAVGWSSLSRQPGWLAWVGALALVGSLHALAARNAFLFQHRQVAMVAPILAATLTFLGALGYAARVERGLREFITRTLGRALKPEVLGHLESNLSLMRPERLGVAVLSADLEGFTALAAKTDPSKLVGTLRRWLHEVTQEVVERSGHLDKYLGDAVIAVWGAPVRLERPAVHACGAALDLKARFAKQKSDLEQRGGGPLELHVGLDVGDAVVGEMGTEHRVSYSVLGAPVATAVRLAQAARWANVCIVVSAAVVAQAKSDYEFRALEPVELPKRSGSLEVFELVGPRARKS